MTFFALVLFLLAPLPPSSGAGVEVRDPASLDDMARVVVVFDEALIWTERVRRAAGRERAKTSDEEQVEEQEGGKSKVISARSGQERYQRGGAASREVLRARRSSYVRCETSKTKSSCFSPSHSTEGKESETTLFCKRSCSARPLGRQSKRAPPPKCHDLRKSAIQFDLQPLPSVCACRRERE